MDVPLDTFHVPFTADLTSVYPCGIQPKIAQKIEQFRPDYIVITLHGIMSYKASSYCYAHNIPFTAFYPGRLPEIGQAMFGVPLFMSRYFVHRFLNRASATLVPARSLMEELREQGIEHVDVWPHGVDLEKFTLPTLEEKEKATYACGLHDRKRPFYLYVARLSQEKNIDEFLQCPVEGTKILVGPEDSGYSITQLRERYPDIVIAGPQRGKDLINYYHCADAFLFTSTNDSFGLVLLEALAVGLPIVGFDTYGPGDVVPPGCGVSYLARSMEGLAACAIKAWQDLQAGVVTPQQCRTYVTTHFSWDKTIDLLIANLHQIPAAALDQCHEEGSGCCGCGS